MFRHPFSVVFQEYSYKFIQKPFITMWTRSLSTLKIISIRIRQASARHRHKFPSRSPISIELEVENKKKSSPPSSNVQIFWISIRLSDKNNKITKFIDNRRVVCVFVQVWSDLFMLSFLYWNENDNKLVVIWSCFVCFRLPTQLQRLNHRKMHKKNHEIFHQGWLVKSPPNPRGIFRAVSQHSQNHLRPSNSVILFGAESFFGLIFPPYDSVFHNISH